MSWLLDTCVISEATKKKPRPEVTAWLDRQEEGELYLSVLTLAEIEKGILKLRESAQRRRLREWLRQDVIERFAHRLLPLDENVALLWGRIQASAELKGRTLPTVDGQIAATAIFHNLRLVTRNTADMRATGAEIFDPWA